jgi:5-methylthioribose kinase
VIDSEFAFVGPMGFDVGALIANLVMSWVSHNVQEGESTYTEWILETIENVWNRFEAKFLALWNATKQSALITQGFADEAMLHNYQQQFMQKLFQESIGFAGCKIMRRQLGIAGVEDIRGIENDAVREQANRLALAIGEQFIKQHHHVKDINDILRLIKETHAG